MLQEVSLSAWGLRRSASPDVEGNARLSLIEVWRACERRPTVSAWKEL